MDHQYPVDSRSSPLAPSAQDDEAMSGVRASAAPAPRMEVVPARALADEPVRIRVCGVPPHEAVTIRAAMRVLGGAPWASHATFRADAHGVVDVCVQDPLAGSSY